MIDRAWRIRITRTAHICIVWRLRLRLRCSARASTSRSAYGSVRINGWRGGVDLSLESGVPAAELEAEELPPPPAETMPMLHIASLTRRQPGSMVQEVVCRIL